MSLIPKIRTRENDNSVDLEIKEGRFKIYFIEKYAVLQLIGDILVGLFFIGGAILNFWDATATLSKVSYLVGSLSFSIRPALKIIKRTWFYNDNKNKQEQSESPPPE